VVGVVVLLVGGGLLLLSSGGSDEGEKRPAETHEAAVQSVGPMPDLRLVAGEEAEFRNDDDVPHTFTADGGLFDSGRVAPGDVFRFSFPAAGELTYHCEIHPSMTGRVVVTAS